jgi:hypothetical protein
MNGARFLRAGILGACERDRKLRRGRWKSLIRELIASTQCRTTRRSVKAKGVDAQTSVATSFNYDIPIERQIRLIAEAGFSHLSLGATPDHSGYLEAARRRDLKARMADLGLAMDTIHASALHHTGAVEQVSATLAAAAELGASFVVAHVGPFNCGPEGLDERLTQVLSVCEALIPFAKVTEIQLALENVMPGPATDLVRRALHALDPAVFGLCCDSSHDQIDGPRPFNLTSGSVYSLCTCRIAIKAHVDHVIPGEAVHRVA